MVASRARRPLTPTVVIGAAAADQSESMNRRVMHLPRPAEQALMVCTVSMAIADGRPLRRSARKPVHRFGATSTACPRTSSIQQRGSQVGGPSQPSIDIAALLQRPGALIGVGVTVQRRWSERPPRILFRFNRREPYPETACLRPRVRQVRPAATVLEYSDLIRNFGAGDPT